MKPPTLDEQRAVFKAIEAMECRDDARLLCARLSFRLATRHRYSWVTRRLIEDVEQAMRDAARLDGGGDE